MSFFLDLVVHIVFIVWNLIVLPYKFIWIGLAIIVLALLFLKRSRSN